MKQGITKLRKGYSILKAAKPLLLAHHPDCEMFKNHTHKIGRHKFCMGCLSTYPTIIISLIILTFINNLFYNFIGWYLIPIGAAFLLLMLINTEKKRSIIINHILIGLGCTLVWLSIFSLPFAFLYNLSIFIAFIILTGLLSGYVLEKQLNICSNDCQYRRHWQYCPGLKDVYRDIYMIQTSNH
jgi:hypothetical protein